MSPMFQESARPDEGRWRNLVAALMGVALVIQCGILVFDNQLGSVLTDLTERRRVEDDQRQFASFVRTHVPSGEAVLYVTPDTRSWSTYLRLSYTLYPSAAWWVTPVNRVSPVDWWTDSPISSSALNNVAREQNANYLVLDGIPIPEGLRYLAAFEYRPNCFVLRLG